MSEHLARPADPTAGGRDILHMKSADPRFRFEWHPKRRRVYLVRIGQTPEIGEVMAFDIETHADAINAVLIWFRGFQEGQAPTIKTHLQD